MSKPNCVCHDRPMVWQRHPEQLNGGYWYCTVVHNERLRGYNRRLREETINAYGARCECCDETEPAFLTLDHIDGRAGEKMEGRTRRTSYQLYRRLRKNGFPPGIVRVLCYNCNCGRERNGGMCPHQEGR